MNETKPDSRLNTNHAGIATALAGALAAIVAAAVFTSAPPAFAQPRLNPLIERLAAGKAALGVWTGATSSPRMTKALATGDADFIVADFPALRSFLLGVQDFSARFRATPPRPAPAVLVKLGGRGHWDPRYEIAETLKIGPAAGIWVPFVESRADVERLVSAVRGAESSAMAGLNVPRERRDPWPLNPQGEFVVVAMIESEAGVDRAEEIIATRGLTAVQPVHLSEGGTAKVVALAKKYNVILATDATPADVQARVSEGYRMISIGWDFNLMKDAVDKTLAAMRPVIK
jgi:2-keto-3-deoxy-L-rhamnonate aldolase RhmA